MSINIIIFFNNFSIFYIFFHQIFTQTLFVILTLSVIGQSIWDVTLYIFFFIFTKLDKSSHLNPQQMPKNIRQKQLSHEIVHLCLRPDKNLFSKDESFQIYHFIFISTRMIRTFDHSSFCETERARRVHYN